MEEIRTEIVPFTITETKTVKYFRVRLENIILFKSVDVVIELLDENYNYVSTRVLYLTGQDYLDWKDDSYITTKAIEFLGVSIPNVA